MRLTAFMLIFALLAGCGSPPPKPTWRLEARIMKYKAGQGIGGEIEFVTVTIAQADKLVDRATCELVRSNTLLERDEPLLLVDLQKEMIALEREEAQRAIRNAGSRQDITDGYDRVAKTIRAKTAMDLEMIRFDEERVRDSHNRLQCVETK